MYHYLRLLFLLALAPLLDAANSTVPPKLTKRVAAEFPFALKMAFMHPTEPATNGTAKIEFVVGATGKVEDAKVVAAAHREMGPPALAAVKKWRFKPASVDGKNVPALMQVEVWFGTVDKPGDKGPDFKPVLMSLMPDTSGSAQKEK